MSRKRRRIERWKPGMYEGLSESEVRAQVGSAVERGKYRGGSSVGLTMTMRPSKGWGKGGMK